MNVKYTEYVFNESYTVTRAIEDFFEEQLINTSLFSSCNKVPLEEQPRKVANALGKLISVLMEKNILSKEDMFNICDADYTLRDRVELVKDDN